MNGIIRTDTDVDELRGTVGQLARQVMLQQLFLEERIRSDGDSGIKQCRINNEGTKTYHIPSISSKKGITALHDHSNHIRTIGLGEFIAVLNGVEFRTRHNDFLLRMPSKTSRNFLETEDIPYPDVPPEVTSKPTVHQQMKEMREWFRAWHNQNYKKRDYRKYFKPVLCYLEGTWIDEDNTDILEPFKSDRHWLDASSFRDLQNKIIFTSYGGRKSSLENFAWLPTTIMDVVNGTIPKYAQWIYRIACHPLKRDIPTSRFRLLDDLSVRMMYLKTMDQQKLSRKARFQLNPRDSKTWRDKLVSNWELIDDLMGEVPGMDNYGGNLTDEAFDNPAMELLKDGKVNTAYYNRWWKEEKLGAMGLSLRKRAFSDRNLFMAMTSQSAVSGKSLIDCQEDLEDSAEVCRSDNQKWSYAIPLEVIYMTPLSKWNPYNIQYNGDADKDPEAAYVTENDIRFGGITASTAYNGTNSKFFYQTPASFFEGRVVDADKADTFRGSVGVLDKNGIVRAVTSSGIRALLPNIPGIGIIRQRYPIMPLHNEGNGIWKELDSLKDIVLEHSRYLKMYRELPKGEVIETKQEKGVILELSPATKPNPGPHIHRIELSPEDVTLLKSGRPVVMITTEESSHSHMVTISYKSWKKNPWIMFRCDGEKECWDGHRDLYLVKDGQ